VWLNLSQEALTAVDELREHGMVRAVRMYTVDYKTITAYQVRILQFHRFESWFHFSLSGGGLSVAAILQLMVSTRILPALHPCRLLHRPSSERNKPPAGV
jgi:hypothetical protein